MRPRLTEEDAAALRKLVHATARQLGLWQPSVEPEPVTWRKRRSSQEWEELDGSTGTRRKRVLAP